MGVYLYPNNTETELKNAYIGEYPERWQPWANTVAYYPLTSTTTVNDLSGNGYTLSTHDTLPTFWIYQWVDCASFNSNSLKTSSVNPWAYWKLARTVKYRWEQQIRNASCFWSIVSWYDCEGCSRRHPGNCMEGRTFRQCEHQNPVQGNTLCAFVGRRWWYFCRAEDYGCLWGQDWAQVSRRK